MKKIFVLLQDNDGTVHSSCEPIGLAVTDEEEAKKFVRNAQIGYARSYEEIYVFDSLEKVGDKVKTVDGTTGKITKVISYNASGMRHGEKGYEYYVDGVNYDEEGGIKNV